MIAYTVRIFGAVVAALAIGPAPLKSTRVVSGPVEGVQVSRPAGIGQARTLLFAAFWSSESAGARLSESLGDLAPAVRPDIERRLLHRRTYVPQLPEPVEGRLAFPLEVVARGRRNLEAAIVALLADPTIQSEAIDYARRAVLSYEWEGDPSGPMAEATFAAEYLRAHPRTKLAPFLHLFMLHRSRCAFEAAIFMINNPYREVTPHPERLREWASHYTAARRAAAAGYVRSWQALRLAPDLVVKAVADDIDARPFLYQPTSEHPRTFAGSH